MPPFFVPMDDLFSISEKTMNTSWEPSNTVKIILVVLSVMTNTASWEVGKRSTGFDVP